MSKNKREKLPDILKGLAVILMIQVHIMELFARQEVFHSSIGKISLFLGGIPAAPIFMAAMGYFLVRTRRSTISMIIRGLKLIGLGLLLNAGLNLHLLVRIFRDNLQINPLEYLFGADILFLAGLATILIALIRKMFGQFYLLYLLLALVIVFVHPYIPYFGSNGAAKYLQAFLYGYYHWSYFPLLPWLAYPLAGYAFGLMKRKQQFNQLLKYENYFWISSFIISVAGFRYAFNISTNLQLYYHHGLLFFLYTIPFVDFWSISLKKLIKPAGKSAVVNYLQWTGKNVTAIYIVQWLIIGNIATAIFKTQELWSLPLWFTGITMASSGIVYLYNRFVDRRNAAVI